jgi:hypothetical protein
VGIDNDYEESEIVTEEFLEAVEDVTSHYFPEALYRRGRSARPPLRVIRLDGDEIAESVNIDKLQILGRGRQFVAYNIHPNTGKPYVWLKEKGIGNPLTVKFDEIPRYSAQTLGDFKAAIHLLEETFGFAPHTAKSVLKRIRDGENPKPRAELHADQYLVERAAGFIVDREDWDWDDWNNNIMMPMWNASKGESWGLELCHKICEPHSEYDSRVVDERWDEISRSPPDLLGWPRLNWLARQEGMPFLGPNSWNTYRVFLDRPEVLNIKNDHWVLDKRFNDLFPEYKEPKMTVMQTFIKNRPDQVFDTVTWNSQLPEGEAEKHGKRLWNTWRTPEWFGEEGDITPWLITMDKVFGDMMELILKRMACDVQYPEMRPQWHILVTGAHGIGKSSTYYPLMEWAKRHRMHSSITPNMLKSEFNSWISRRKIVTLNEIHGITPALWDDLKDMFAGGEDEISVNEKMLRRVSESIVASFYMSSNHRDAVSISRTERRILVHHSLEPSPQDNPKYQDEFKAAFTWLAKNWPLVIHYLKHEIKVDREFIQTHPGQTLGQIQMSDMTAPVFERIAEKIKILMKNRPVFELEDVNNALVGDEMLVEANREGGYHNKTIIKAIYHLGGVKLNKGQAIKLGKAGERGVNGHMNGYNGAKMNGNGLDHMDKNLRPHLWSLDPELEKAPNSQIRFLYELFPKTEN